MDSDRVRVTERWRTVPLVAPRAVWIVWENGEMAGPVDCLALVVGDDTLTCETEIEHFDYRPRGGSAGWMIPSTHAHDAIQARRAYPSLTIAVHYFLAVDNGGEAPIFPQEYVFFTEQAARERAARERAAQRRGEASDVSDVLTEMPDA